jgi:cell division protein FtsB
MKKAIFIFIVVILIIAINNQVHSIYDLWHKQDLLTNAQKELNKEKLKNQKLKTSLNQVNTDQFIEQEAHDKLFMVREGEQKVLIAQNLLPKQEDKKQKDNNPNWQKWLKFSFSFWFLAL